MLIKHWEPRADAPVTLSLILIELGALDATEAVLKVQGMGGVVLRQILDLTLSGLFDVDPYQLPPGDGLDIKLLCCNCWSSYLCSLKYFSALIPEPCPDIFSAPV